MTLHASLSIPLAAWVLVGCATPPPSKTADTKTPETATELKITQFYATTPQLQRGEKETLCYGVENATKVSISPPQQDLAPSRSRCFDVAPAQNTVYRLTAESADGKSVSQEVAVQIGPAKAKIVEVQVSTLNAKRGDTVSICYSVLNTQSVTIEPINYKAGGKQSGCATHQPTAATTYTVNAIGASGERDQEKVTVRVQ